MASRGNAFRQPQDSVWQRIRIFLTGRDKSVPRLARRKNVALFLDAKQLERRYKAIDRGAEDGRQNRPLQEAEDPSEFEGHLISECNKALTRLKDEVKARTFGTAAVMQKLRSRLKLDILNTRLKEIARNLRTNCRSLLDSSKASLTEKKKTELESRAYYNWFRKHHERRLPPKRVLGVITVASLLFLYIVGEGFLNAQYFMKAGGGLIGGFAVAGGVSALNVLCSFLVGVYVTRLSFYIWKRHPILKLLGIIITVAWMAFLVPVHLSVGHYRDYLADSISNGGAEKFQLWTILTTEPLSIESFESWLLFGVGMLLGLLSLLKGATLSNDPYPGYGKAGQQLIKSTHAVEQATDEVRKKLDSLEVGAMAAAEELVNGFDDVIDDYRAKLSEYELLIEGYEECRIQIEDAFLTVITNYRRANEEVRTHAAPLYFSIAPQLDKTISRDFGDADATLEELVGERAMAKEALSRFREAVQKDVSRMRNMLEIYLGNIGGIAKAELEAQDPFFAEHGGKDIMLKASKEPATTTDSEMVEKEAAQ